MKRILVLGGTRFFGKQLVYNLLEKGHDVTIATRGLAKDDLGKRISRLKIDRTDKSSLISAFKQKNWDIVFDQSCYTPQEANDTLQSLKGNVKRYIFTSSQSVYDFGENRKEEDFNPFTYTFSYKPRREYSGFKGYQEGKRAAESVFLTQQGLDVVAVRFPIVIGNGDHTRRLKILVERVVNDKPIGISNEQKRYSFIDCQEASGFLLGIGTDSLYKGSINPGCRDDISLKEIIRIIEAGVNKKALITNQITSENVCPYELEGSCSVNTDRANKLGFKFSNINKILHKNVKYYMDNN